MCGIVGYLGSFNYKEYILSGLKLLQNRGYDSVGVCCNYNNSLQVIKYASENTHDSLEKLENSIQISLASSRSVLFFRYKYRCTSVHIHCNLMKRPFEWTPVCFYKQGSDSLELDLVPYQV